MIEILSTAYGALGWASANWGPIAGILTFFGIGFAAPRTWTQKFGFYCGRALQKLIFRKSGMDSDKKLWNNVRNTLYDFFHYLAEGIKAK